jgi:hypothetical protein
MEEDANLAVPTALSYMEDETPAGPSKAFTKFRSEREFETEANDGSDEELEGDYQIDDDMGDKEKSDESDSDEDNE